MELWELVKRILDTTHGAQTFAPLVVIGQYKRDVEARGESFGIDDADLEAVADEVAEMMESAGLIAAVPQNGITKVLNAKAVTQFGGELHSWLRGKNVVTFFESMHTDVERGAIQRMLHQLNS